MSVKIVIPSSLRVFTGDAEVIKVEGDTTGECLENLASLFPMIGRTIFFRKGELFNFGHNQVSVFLNGEDTHPDEMTRLVRDGDTLHLIFKIGGG